VLRCNSFSLNSGDSAVLMEKFDVYDVVAETIKRYEGTLREKGLRFNIDRVENSVFLFSDRSKIKRIFQNIFNNAVKFTSTGEITIKTYPSTDGTGVQFEVADTNVGIEKNKLDSIFDPFHQADTSSQQSFSDLGLGLTVARRMAELIGG